MRVMLHNFLPFILFYFLLFCEWVRLYFLPAHFFSFFHFFLYFFWIRLQGFLSVFLLTFLFIIIPLFRSPSYPQTHTTQAYLLVHMAWSLRVFKRKDITFKLKRGKTKGTMRGSKELNSSCWPNAFSPYRRMSFSSKHQRQPHFYSISRECSILGF